MSAVYIIIMWYVDCKRRFTTQFPDERSFIGEWDGGKGDVDDMIQRNRIAILDYYRFITHSIKHDLQREWGVVVGGTERAGEPFVICISNCTWIWIENLLCSVNVCRSGKISIGIWPMQMINVVKSSFFMPIKQNWRQNPLVLSSVLLSHKA